MRTLHKWYAAIFGYFWVACPNCGRMFGGHEKWHFNRDGERVWCPKCDPNLPASLTPQKHVELEVGQLFPSYSAAGNLSGPVKVEHIDKVNNTVYLSSDDE